MPVKFTSSTRAFARLFFHCISWLTWLPTWSGEQQVTACRGAGHCGLQGRGGWVSAWLFLWHWLSSVCDYILGLESGSITPVGYYLSPRNMGVPLKSVGIFTRATESGSHGGSSDQWRICDYSLFSGRTDGKFPSKFLRLGALVILLPQAKLCLWFRQRWKE